MWFFGVLLGRIDVLVNLENWKNGYHVEDSWSRFAESFFERLFKSESRLDRTTEIVFLSTFRIRFKISRNALAKANDELNSYRDVQTIIGTFNNQYQQRIDFYSIRMDWNRKNLNSCEIQGIRQSFSRWNSKKGIFLKF